MPGYQLWSLSVYWGVPILSSTECLVGLPLLLWQSPFAPQAGLKCTVPLPHPECWNYGSLSQCLSSSCVLNSVLSWQITVSWFYGRESRAQLVCRLTPKDQMGCEHQANFKVWWFLTTLLCLVAWKSMKGSFLPKRYEKYLSWAIQMRRHLWDMSLHLKMHPISPSVLTSSCCMSSNQSPAEAQVSDAGPSISERLWETQRPRSPQS